MGPKLGIIWRGQPELSFSQPPTHHQTTTPPHHHTALHATRTSAPQRRALVFRSAADPCLVLIPGLRCRAPGYQQIRQGPKFHVWPPPVFLLYFVQFEIIKKSFKLNWEKGDSPAVSIQTVYSMRTCDMDPVSAYSMIPARYSMRRSHRRGAAVAQGERLGVQRKKWGTADVVGYGERKRGAKCPRSNPHPVMFTPRKCSLRCDIYRGYYRTAYCTRKRLLRTNSACSNNKFIA